MYLCYCVVSLTTLLEMSRVFPGSNERRIRSNFTRHHLHFICYIYWYLKFKNYPLINHICQVLIWLSREVSRGSVQLSTWLKIMGVFSDDESEILSNWLHLTNYKKVSFSNHNLINYFPLPHDVIMQTYFISKC